MLSVVYVESNKKSFMPSVSLNVITLNVVMLRVMALCQLLKNILSLSL